jgi:hypothetical protein
LATLKSVEKISMNEHSYEKPSGPASGAIAGALTAASLLFLLTMVPAVIGVIQSPEVAGWLFVIFVFTMFWAFVAAIAGAVAGGLAAKKGKPLQGALIGVLMAAPIVCCYKILFISAEEPMVATLVLIFYGAVIGAASGCVGSVVGGRASIKRDKPGRVAGAESSAPQDA